MNVWCYISTIFNQRLTLRRAGFVLLFVVLITAIVFVHSPVSAQSTNRTIHFQGRLLTSSGGVVPDGYYNMQFKIYEGGAGSAAGNPGGTLKWTENHINNGGNNGVFVRNGVFSVSLGSRTTFANNIDWNAETLWLSMNIAGSDSACSSFGDGACAADGEMLPMKQITATPYALNAGAVGGKTIDNLLQLAQGVQTDASSNTSSIFINKTGAGNLVQLQNTATDIFTIDNTGNLTLGSNQDKTISVAVSEENTAGKQLSMIAGEGGSGDGAAGGDLVLQGGSAGGTNGNGGNVSIDAGAATGSGSSGTIAIGTTHASSITIGATTGTAQQNITIGANNTAGSSTDVTLGSGEGAESGTTTVQAKNSVVIATNGTDRATFSDTTNTVYFGNGVSATAPDNYTIQGTNSTSSAVAGGTLTVQGGNATTGNTNGGNLVLTGGTGSGAGANGLVVLTTPTFSTVANDTNCYTGGTVVESSCVITQSSVDSSSAILIGFSANDQSATLPDPTITTAGRILYLMASGNSQPFTLIANSGGNEISMQSNTALTMLWNGEDWIPAGGASSTTLQDAYNNSPQSAGGVELTLGGEGRTGGLTIREDSTAPSSDSLISVKDSTNNSLFSINNTVKDATEFAADGMVNNGDAFATNWQSTGSASITRNDTDGQESNDSVEVAAGTPANNGVRNKLLNSPQTDSDYRISVYAKLVSGTAFSDFNIRYSPDGGSSFVNCSNYNAQQVVNDHWSHITCDITTSATETTDPYVYFTQPTVADEARTWRIDAFSFTRAATAAPNVKVGGADDGSTTLFTVDKSDTAPTSENHEALLGSMYYDTTLGKLQCYEESGWGPCSASPDNFVTMSPEYANAVMNGTDTGVMTSDICSDALDINDGTAGQPTVCGTNETYNFYQWTTTEETAKTKGIYVTYQLPNNFKEFVAGSTSLLGRTDSNDSQATYQIYRNSTSGLTPCGPEITVSTGSQSVWQKAVASGDSDPSHCGFEPGDSIVFRINLTAKDNAKAYVSNLNFTISSN